jgi:class 3 adenylate cyclase
VIEMTENISDRYDEEYGEGSEVETTGFLVFGILTIWIYTVIRYFSILRNHFEVRKHYFLNKLSNIQMDEKAKKDIIQISEYGFKINATAKWICSFLYAICAAIIVVEFAAQHLYAVNRISENLFNTFTLYAAGIGSFLFCVSTIYFLSWVCKTIKNHEYHELLLLKLLENPSQTKKFKTSPKFLKRWNQNANLIALFLILAFPMVISPYVAVSHIYSVFTEGGEYLRIIFWWSILIFSLGAVFHLSGIKVLFLMYNGHLRIEAANAGDFARSTNTGGSIHTSVLVEKDFSGTHNDTGDLIPKRSLAAIMFTDIVGFSQKMETDESQTYKTLMIHNRMVRESIDRFHGQEIKTIGDAFLVKFSSAVDAVKAGIEIQSSISKFNQSQTEDRAILLRIGIHIGDILMMDNDVIGNGVNIAARIEPLADPGGICISADVYSIVKKTIELKVVQLTQQELKNITEAPEIYKIVLGV